MYRPYALMFLCIVWKKKKKKWKKKEIKVKKKKKKRKENVYRKRKKKKSNKGDKMPQSEAQTIKNQCIWNVNQKGNAWVCEKVRNG